MSSSLLLHLFIVAPACQYFLQSGRFPRVKGLLYAISFLVVLAVASEYQTWSTRPRNLYSILDVDVTATGAELHKANLQMSRKLHPDKNPSPDAQAQFTELAAAYEILSSPEDRHLYDRFGMEAVKRNRHTASASQTHSQALVDTAMFYVVWSVLTYLLTMGKSSAAGRSWAYTGLILLGVLEFNMTLSSFDFLTNVFTRTTPRDKLDLLHSLYPAFMNGCRILSQFTFVDMEEQTRQMLFMLLKTNSDIITALSQIAATIEKKGAVGGKSTGAGLMNADGTGKEVTAESSADADKGPAWKLQRAKAENQRMNAAMQEEQKKKMAIPGWVWTVGFLVFFNYVLK